MGDAVVWDWDIKRDILKWYGNTTEVIGYATSELPNNGNAWKSFIIAEDRTRVTSALHRHMVQNEPYVVDYRIARKDGAPAYCRDRGVSIRNRGGKVIRMVGTINDITSRLHAEQRFTAIVKTVPVVIYEFLRTPAIQVFTFVSDKIRDVAGISAEAMMADAKVFFSAIHPEDVAATLAASDHAGHTLTPFFIEFRLCRPDGEVRWIHAASLPREGDLNASVWCGFLQDITDRKRTEEALQESESRLRVAFDNVPFEFWVRDREQRCIMENAKVVEHWGSILGLRPEDASVSEETLAIWKANNQQAFKGEVVKSEVMYPFQNGYHYYQSIVAPVRVGKEIRGILGCNIDITDLKQAEGALRNLSQQLLRLQDEERRSIARELHDTTAQKLVGLLLNLSSLKQRSAERDQRDRQLLEECMQLAKQSIDELRTLSFLLHPPQLEHFGLIGAIKDLCEEFGRRSGIRMKVKLAAKCRTLPQEYDLTLLRILQEALANVHRHSGSKTAAITLACRRSEIYLIIQDTGRGMLTDLSGKKGSTIRHGVGIPGIRERLRYLGGRLEIATGKKGTTLTAILPMPLKTKPKHRKNFKQSRSQVADTLSSASAP